MTERPAVHDDERDLPGLIGWGDTLLEATERAERAGGADDRRARRRRFRRRRAIPLLAAIGVLVVPGAVVATRSIWDDPVTAVDPAAPRASTPAIRLVEGRTGDVSWRIGGWNAGGGRVCLRTEAWRGSVRAMVGSTCAVPSTPARLIALRTGPGQLTLIVGTTAPEVRTVRVTPPVGDAVRVAAVAVPAESLRRSGLADAARIYVAVFARGFETATRAPAIEAFGAGDELLGAIGGGTR